MKKKDKVTIIVAVTCMILTVFLGLTYAYWLLTKEQVGMNVMESGCFEIEFEEANDIELKNAIPISDEKGMQMVPYTFTIKNICDTFANYQINLETLEVETGKNKMPSEYIRTNLQKGKKDSFDDVLKSDYEVIPTISGSAEAYRLAVGYLREGNTHTYNLRVWMDKSVTAQDLDSMNAVFKAKISIILSPSVDPFSESGTLQVVPDSYSSNKKFWQYSSSITEVEFQDKMEPIEGALYSWDVSATNDGKVMAYITNISSDGITKYKLFIQGNGGIKANPNSSNLFYRFNNVEKITGLEFFDTSKVTNMQGMFELVGYNKPNFTLDVSSFDTSNVTNMSAMFAGCSTLMELDVSNFDTSNVTDMSLMFSTLPMFDNMKIETLDLSGFDTHNVTNMRRMFYDCYYLTEIKLSNWDTSSVTTMEEMFECAGFKSSSLTLDVSKWDTSSVTNMANLFDYCKSLMVLDVSNWNTSNVTTMSAMFWGCENLLELDLSKWDTSNVTNMNWMFYDCTKLEKLDVSNFDTSNVTTMLGMFCDCSSLISLDLRGWNTSNVIIMGSTYSSLDSAMGAGMFEKCTKLSYLNLSSFDTSNVTTMGDMFYNIGSEIDQVDIIIGDGFDTSNVVEMSGMFNGSGNAKLNFDFSKLNFISVKRAYRMFDNSRNINGVLNFNSTDVICYYIFNNAATASGVQLMVNYTSENEDLVDSIIASIRYDSNIIKGTQLTDYTISLDGSYSSLVNLSSATGYRGKMITLSPIQSNKVITSFKVNGILYNGDSFTMPNSNVTITDVNIIEGYTIESEHNPYANNINSVVYYENTFQNATSITVKLTYQTESTSYDWVYLYTSPSAIYQNKRYGGTALTTETITIDGNYLKITFKTNSGGNNYYGFKAVIIPNYD